MQNLILGYEVKAYSLMHLYSSRVISKVAWYSTVEPKILYLESKGELHCMTLDCHLSRHVRKDQIFLTVF